MSKGKKLDLPMEKLIEIASALNNNTLANKNRLKEEKIINDKYILQIFAINRKNFTETIKETNIKYNPKTFLYQWPSESFTSNDCKLSKPKVSIIPINDLSLPKKTEPKQQEVILKKEIIEVVKNAIELEFPELIQIINLYKQNKISEVIDLPEINIEHPKLTGELFNKSFKTYKGVLNDFVDFCNNRKENQKDLIALSLVEFMDKYK